MKKFLIVAIALLLALLAAFQQPVQVIAANADEKYISEIRLGVGKKAEEALAALDGYEILKGDDGKPVDLNKNAGGGVGSKGDRVVYLGFLRTSNKAEAITDLAVMNMKGPYSTTDYDALMGKYVKEQIIPFVNTFIAAIEEYRANYNSTIEANRARARYLHDALNKFTDDDCGGAGLGDLLLNETKYEMGDAAYNALSAEQKKQHADIVTIIAQANGQATLLLENLLLKAADTEETTWLERFLETSYEDMEDETGLAPSKALAELGKLYYDDAMKILEMWDTFKEQLDNYDTALALLEEINVEDVTGQEETIRNFDLESANEEQAAAFGEAIAEIKINGDAYINAFSDVICKDYLETVEYDMSYFSFVTAGDTLLDFFTLDYEDVYEEIECLYPLIASLSPGQRAGLDFTSLQELILIGINDSEGYKNAEYDEMEPVSIYTGVDREIYAKGGVGLTSDALRQDALSKMAEENDGLKLGGLTIAGYALAGAALVGLGASLAARGIALSAVASTSTESITNSSLYVQLQGWKTAVKTAEEAKNFALTAEKEAWKYAMTVPSNHEYMVLRSEAFNKANAASEVWKGAEQSYKDIYKKSQEFMRVNKTAAIEENLAKTNQYIDRMNARSALCTKLAVGFTVVLVVVTAVTVWMTFRDLKNHYKVDFTPIPGYMVDEKDITAFNSKGEKIVIKNQGAYYKAVLCNRTEGDYYDILGDKGDLNGYVGKQWLALYAENNEVNDPVLADSLKFSDKDQIPAGYEKGIHMFGSSAAENLNNPLYVWKSDAPKAFVYFKTEAGAGVTGSGFSAGSIGLGALGGLLLGGLGTVAVMSAKKKKEETVGA